MNKKIVVANWKQNLNIAEASHFMHRLQELVKKRQDTEVVICPGFVALHPLHRQIDNSKFKLGAQAIHWEDSSPATGEVGGPMLRGLAKYSIVGHSYRRAHLGVTDVQVGKKVAACLRNNIVPIICIGENALERAEDRTRQVVKSQLDSALSSVTSQDMENVIVTYEPVWAISTNKGHKEPVVDDITTAIEYMRNTISDRYGSKVAESTVVLYGGSVNVSNSKDYIIARGVNGFLIGGASLKQHDFAEIIKNVQDTKTDKE